MLDFLPDRTDTAFVSGWSVDASHEEYAMDTTIMTGREKAVLLVVACLRANTDALYAGTRAYEEFSKIGCGLWDKARADGIDGDVMSALRNTERVTL